MEGFAARALLAQMNVPDVEALAGEIHAWWFRYLPIILLLSLCVWLGQWGVFVKAGEPGWAALVPIYNVVVLFRIAGMPEWYVMLLFIPCLGPIAALVLVIKADIELSKRFNMGEGFTLGLVFLPFIFYPILGFGSAEYEDGRRPRRRRKRGGVATRIEAADDEEDARRREPVRERRRFPNDEAAERDDEASPPVRRTFLPPASAPTGTRMLTCPGCGVSLRTSANLAAGKRLRCPKCNTRFTTPG